MRGNSTVGMLLLSLATAAVACLLSDTAAEPNARNRANEENRDHLHTEEIHGGENGGQQQDKDDQRGDEASRFGGLNLVVGVRTSLNAHVFPLTQSCFWTQSQRVIEVFWRLPVPDTL